MPQINKQYCLYVLECSNGSYYAGITTDISRRFSEHMTGGAKYTKAFKPVRLLAAWRVDGGLGAALKAERFFKKLTRSAKEVAVNRPDEFAQGYQQQCGRDMQYLNIKNIC